MSKPYMFSVEICVKTLHVFYVPGEVIPVTWAANVTQCFFLGRLDSCLSTPLQPGVIQSQHGCCYVIHDMGATIGNSFTIAIVS